MATKLIVTEPFGKYQKGDEITDKKTVQAVQAGDNAAHVVVVQSEEKAEESK